jgi:carboxymethylenebutenolidase
MEKIMIPLPDGDEATYLFHSKGTGINPLIILFMDAFGPRPALYEICELLADNGYNVVIPDLFYNFDNYPPFEPKTAFNPGPERLRLMGMIQSLKIKHVMTNTRILLESLAGQASIDFTRIATLGYCMGGKFALSAATFFREKVLAAASIHGGGLVTDQPDSPHLQVPKIKAKVYVGVAIQDRSFTDEQRLILETAFNEANTNATMEIYPGAYHGFAVRDMAAFNADAADLHINRILQLFKETLS